MDYGIMTQVITPTFFTLLDLSHMLKITAKHAVDSAVILKLGRRELLGMYCENLCLHVLSTGA